MFDGSPPKTAREIADGVRRPAALVAGEAELRKCKTRAAEIGAEIGRLHASRDAINTGTVDNALRQLDAEQRAIVAKIAPLRRQVVALRAERGKAVRAALAELIADTAARAHSAAIDFAAAMSDLAAVDAALTASAGDPIWAPTPAGLALTIERLAQLAGRG